MSTIGAYVDTDGNWGLADIDHDNIHCFFSCGKCKARTTFVDSKFPMFDCYEMYYSDPHVGNSCNITRNPYMDLINKYDNTIHYRGPILFLAKGRNLTSKDIQIIQEEIDWYRSNYNNIYR